MRKRGRPEQEVGLQERDHHPGGAVVRELRRMIWGTVYPAPALLVLVRDEMLALRLLALVSYVL